MIRRLIQTGLCALTLLAAPLAMAEAKVPTTAAEHLTLAKKYEQQAAANRQEAQDHREMAEAFRKANPQSRKGWEGQKNAKVEAMDKHCAALATAAENLAAENQKAADFHTLRAKELQGK